jgi:23S rRNA-/tRNA-specific pseudouridylate synthase
VPDYKKSINKGLCKQQDFIQTYIVPFFRIEVLLWQLNFFSNSHEVKQVMKSKLIFVNNKYVLENYALKAGDIITISNIENKKYFFSFAKKSIFYSFVEVDYYTGTIIVLKDPSLLRYKEIAFFYESYTSPKKLQDYVKKK